jgi:hypothetical protein
VNITHLEEIEREQLVAPLSYTRIASPDIGGEGGPGNYWVPVCCILITEKRHLLTNRLDLPE